MYLSTLLHDIITLDPMLDRDITGLAQDSRQVQPGYLFLAWRGKTFDGRDYVQQAIAAGAVAVLAEAGVGIEQHDGVPIIPIPQLNHHLPTIAARFFNHPTQQLQLIGVTGTNGKTSCTHFIAQALQQLSAPCGVIGTIGCGMLGALQENRMTTPSAIDLQQIFAACKKQQAQYMAMEVSSHSLDQERIKGLSFAVGVFTNLTQDHLDYHGDMTAYGAAKQRFFTDYPMKKAVINVDDAFGRALIASLPQDKVIGYSTGPREKVAFPAVYAQNPHFNFSGLQATVFTPWGEGELQVPLMGEFNLSNVLAVLATLGALGFPLNKMLSALTAIHSAPGRMQVFGGGSRPRVIVDYAHTPDALEKTLRALRQHCSGTLYCVFGCGGDRDKGKRPIMGAIAEQYADRVMLTSDNPRHENPQTILTDILAGMKNPQQVGVEVNRSKAMQDIIQYAKQGDYVLIAGKGAEAYQLIGDEKLPFSDGERVVEILHNISSPL